MTEHAAGHDAEHDSFRALQFRVAQHLRDPARQPAPDGVDAERLAVYAELLFNSVFGALSSVFPVLRSVLGDEHWRALVRDFYREYRSPYPQLHRAAEAFVEYLHEARAPHADDPPFLRDLAHYEWIELEVALVEEGVAAGAAEVVDTDADLLNSVPRLVSASRVLAYDYPVQRIGPDWQPRFEDAQPTYLAVYRDAALAVKFIELTAASARLLLLIEEHPQACGAEVLELLATELAAGQADVAALQSAGLRLLLGFRRCGLLRAAPRGGCASAARR